MTRHPRIGGNDRIHVADIVAGVQGDIATAQGAHTFEEVAKIHPPSGGSDVANSRFAKQAIWSDIASAIQPIDGKLVLGIGHQDTGRVQRFVSDAALGGYVNIPAGQCVLGRPRLLLDGAQ